MENKRYCIDWSYLANKGKLNLSTNFATQNFTSGSFATLAGSSATGAGTITDGVSVLLRALDTFGTTEVLSQPRVMLLNNTFANIQVGSSKSYVDSYTTTQSTEGTTTAATTNSVTSAITEFSQTDGSGSNPPMMLPFPFHGRPGLPHVDDFVAKCKLSYDHLRLMNNLEKKALILMKQIKAPNNTRILHYEEDKKEIASSSSKPYGNGDKVGFVDDEENSSNSDDNTSRHSLSLRQIRFFLKYIQFFGEIDSKSSKYRGVTYTDIETGLRMYARSIHAPHGGGGIEDTNDLLMAMFDDLLTQSKLKPTQWFQLQSMEVAGNERKITKEMFTSNVRSMCRQHDLPIWTDLEMRQLRLHLSLDGQTEPTLNGVLRAFRRYRTVTIPFNTLFY